MNTNKIYCQERIEKIIDWWDRIEQIPYVDIKTLENWVNESNSWVTCACGNQCAIIPRDKMGEPEDYVLFDLGMKFNDLMEGVLNIIDDPAALDDNINYLKYTLENIEKRSAYLIEKIKAEKQ